MRTGAPRRGAGVGFLEVVVVKTHVITALSLGTCSLACFPIIQNLTPRYPAEPALAALASDDARFLVLPVWNDDGPCNVRSSFVLAASEIASLGEHLESRHRLGLYDAAGHGPSHFRRISGILVLSSDARALWVQSGRYPDGNAPEVYWRLRYRRDFDRQRAAHLRNWIDSTAKEPPASLELSRLIAWCERYQVKLSGQERRQAIEFIDAITYQPRPDAFNGWTDGQRGIQRPMD